MQSRTISRRVIKYDEHANVSRGWNQPCHDTGERRRTQDLNVNQQGHDTRSATVTRLGSLASDEAPNRGSRTTNAITIATTAVVASTSSSPPFTSSSSSPSHRQLVILEHFMRRCSIRRELSRLSSSSTTNTTTSNSSTTSTAGHPLVVQGKK